MTFCRLDPCVFSARFYESHVQQHTLLTDEAAKFTGTAVVSVQGCMAVVSAASGEMARKSGTSLIKQLKALGVNRVYWERHKNGRSYVVEKEI